MKERPITFTAGSIRAIIDGRKTMTRRIIKNGGETMLSWMCRIGQPGDLLWAKEDYKLEIINHPRHEDDGDCGVRYIADDAFIDYSHDLRRWQEPWDKGGDKKRNARFMFKWASRIFLEVTAVRVERVQDINDRDAMREGLSIVPSAHNKAFVTGEDWIGRPRDVFRLLWDSINAKRGYGWHTNPWVWVIEFKRIEARAALERKEPRE